MSRELFDLSGQVALVTGSAGIFGPAHATAILECGGRVVLTDISFERLEKMYEQFSDRYGVSNVFRYVMDVTSEESVRAARRAMEASFGNPSVLINNAATDPKVTKTDDSLARTRLETFLLDDWDAEIRVGLTGALLCSKVFGAEMARSGGGVIINVASDLSIIAPDQRLYKREGLVDTKQMVKPVSYSVIKHGLVGLTKYLATYWANNGVRANALSPGGIFQDQPPDFVAKLSALIPMGRMAELDDYIGAVQFLATDASRYMTGQNLVVDGGRTVW